MHSANAAETRKRMRSACAWNCRRIASRGFGLCARKRSAVGVLSREISNLLLMPPLESATTPSNDKHAVPSSRTALLTAQVHNESRGLSVEWHRDRSTDAILSENHWSEGDVSCF